MSPLAHELVIDSLTAPLKPPSRRTARPPIAAIRAAQNDPRYALASGSKRTASRRAENSNAVFRVLSENTLVAE